jgi:hypothetical protein
MEPVDGFPMIEEGEDQTEEGTGRGQGLREGLESMTWVGFQERRAERGTGLKGHRRS